MAKIDDIVIKHFLGRIVRPNRLRTIIGKVLEDRSGLRSRATAEVDSLKRQLASCETKINNLYRLLESGNTVKDDLLIKRLLGHQLVRPYVRSFIDRITIGRQEIRIRGPKTALANAAEELAADPAAAVPTFVQNWRTRHDSNV